MAFHAVFVPHVDDLGIDFGTEISDPFCASRQLPHALLRKLGELSMDLTVSTYPVDGPDAP